MDNTQRTINKNVWSRGINKIYSEFIQILKEKEFTSEKGQTLRYMFFQKSIVKFSWSVFRRVMIMVLGIIMFGLLPDAR